MIEPGSPEWLSIITPSKVAAIIGLSRFESPYRLWHRMKGIVPPEPPKDIFDVGHAAEQMLAELWRIQNPAWQLSRGEVQIPREGLGFPTLATIDRRGRRGALRRCVEFKIATGFNDLEMWGDDLTGDLPSDYYVQLQWQMHITGYTDYAAHLLCMGPYFKHKTYVVEYDPNMAADLEEECRKFHASLQRSTPPDLDDSVMTYECVRELNPDLEDRTIELSTGFAARYLEVARAFKLLETEYRGLKTQLLDEMGSASRATAAELPIARRQSNGKGSISLYPNTKTNTDDLRSLIAS